MPSATACPMSGSKFLFDYAVGPDRLRFCLRPAFEQYLHMKGLYGMHVHVPAPCDTAPDTIGSVKPPNIPTCDQGHRQGMLLHRLLVPLQASFFTLDPLALLSVVVMSFVLMRSTRESSLLNSIIVGLHILLILFVLIAGARVWLGLSTSSPLHSWRSCCTFGTLLVRTPQRMTSDPERPEARWTQAGCIISLTYHSKMSVGFPHLTGFPHVKSENYSPFIPPEFGIRGVFTGASVVFFSFIGFDTVGMRLCCLAHLSLTLCIPPHTSDHHAYCIMFEALNRLCRLYRLCA